MNNQNITSNINYTNLDSNNNNNKSNKLKVGVLSDALPFSICVDKTISKNTVKNYIDYDGIAVKLWEQVANIYNLDYNYECINDTYDNVIKNIDKNNFDVILGDFTLLPRRLEYALFTRPYYISEIRIFRKSRKSIISNLLSSPLFIGLWILFLIIILGFTFIYKNYKHTTFLIALYKTYSEFFTNEMFFFKDNNNSNYIKLINISWSIIRFSFFAVIITQLINIILQTEDEIKDEEVENIKDLYAIEGTSWVDVAKNMGKTPITVKGYKELKNIILESDKPIYFIHETQSAISKLGNIGLESTPHSILLDEITLAVNKKRPDLLDKINTTLVRLQDNGEMLKICKGYLPDRYDACLL